VVRALGGLVLLPALPFLSAVLWRVGPSAARITFLLTVAGYLGFFFVAMGWGALLVATAAAWCLIGCLVTEWRRHMPVALSETQGDRAHDECSRSSTLRTAPSGLYED
jgi:hypothetical protein